MAPLVARHAVTAFALLAFLRGIVYWLAFHAHLDPDTRLFTDAGWGALYPSPGGALLGRFGYDGLAAISVTSAALLVVSAARLGRALHRSSWQTAAWATLVPVAFYAAYPGVDAVGALLLLEAARADLRRDHRRASCFALVAAFFHFAAIPIALGWAIARHVRTRFGALVLVGCTTAASGLAAMTPYGGIYRAAAHPQTVAIWGGLTLLAALWPYGLAGVRIARAARIGRFKRGVIGVAIATAFVGGVQAAADKHTQTTKGRYALPLAMLVAPLAARKRGNR